MMKLTVITIRSFKIIFTFIFYASSHQPINNCFQMMPKPKLRPHRSNLHLQVLSVWILPRNWKRDPQLTLFWYSELIWFSERYNFLNKWCIIIKGKRNPAIFIFKWIFFSKKCGEKELPCHRLILIARSPVFKSMFSCKTFSESRNGEVIIEDISYGNLNLNQKISKVPNMQKIKQKFTNYAVIIEDILYGGKYILTW